MPFPAFQVNAQAKKEAGTLMINFEITVINWEKYNPRKDVKKSGWYRMNDDYLFNEDTSHFDLTTHAVWTYVLCGMNRSSTQVLRKIDEGSTQVLRTSNVAMMRVLPVKTEGVLRALAKLQQIGWLTFSSRNVDVHYETVRNDTERNGTRRNETTHAPYGGVKAVRKKARTKKTETQEVLATPKADAVASPVTQIRKVFFEAFFKEFNRDYPGWGAKENSQAKNWLRSVSLERACELCELFPMWNDAWVTERGHTFGLLVTKYVELDAWAKSAPRLIEKIAQYRAARSVDLKNAIQKEESKRGFEYRMEAQRKQNAEDACPARTIHPELSSEPETGLCGFSGDPHVESVFASGFEDPHAEGDTNS